MCLCRSRGSVCVSKLIYLRSLQAHRLLQSVLAQVFRCNQAAIVLAKRGENILRCFIGVSPGGRSEHRRVVIVSVAASARPSVKHACLRVGQSLYSSHLDAVYAHSHKFIDPNIIFGAMRLKSGSKSSRLLAASFLRPRRPRKQTSVCGRTYLRRPCLLTALQEGGLMAWSLA